MTSTNSKGVESLERAGWHWLSSSPKWHFFTQDGRSICGKWMTFGRNFEQGNDDSADNCAACKRKLAALRQAATRARSGEQG